VQWRQRRVKCGSVDRQRVKHGPKFADPKCGRDITRSNFYFLEFG